MHVGDLARWVVLLAELWLALPIAYLVLITCAATLASARRATRSHAVPGTPSALPTFAVLIPAHNEEAVITAVLASVSALDYPRDHFATIVIADNCTDNTAALATRVPGVQVFKRTDAVDRGKGYALRWIWQQLSAAGLTFDAYVVLDADSVIEQNFLQAMAIALLRGHDALQGQYAVLNAEDSPNTALRWIALTLMNHVRPLGRDALGGSSTLTGNGMCLSRALLERHPWQAFGLTEDNQYYLALVVAGGRVRYVPGAVVRAVMPTSARQMLTQDIRWESRTPGQTREAWRTAARLVRAGMGQRDIVRLDAAAELLTPPLSVVVVWWALVLAAALALRAPVQVALAIVLGLGALGYVSSAFYLLRPPRRIYAALAYAPAFVMRKLWVYLVLGRSKKYTSQWVRTSRAADR